MGEPCESRLGKFDDVDDTTNDELFMRAALDIAIVAAGHEDVPVGCVLVENDVVIGVGENRRELDQDPTAHAEIVALRDAAFSRPSWRMDEVTAYVTLEPCVMCAGALLNARVRRVVIGALDEKAGAVGSRYNVLSDPRLLARGLAHLRRARRGVGRTAARVLRRAPRRLMHEKSCVDDTNSSRLRNVSGLISRPC